MTATDPSPGRTGGLRRLAVAVCLVGMCLAVIVRVLTGWGGASMAAIACYLGFAVTAQGYFGLRERLLQGFALLLTVAGVLQGNFADLGTRALDQATFLAAFMILLAILREGAITSPSVFDLGRYLTHQPPGRRYIAITLGAQVMGVVLNFGALSLLGPLIQRGARAGAETAPELFAIRERRQMLALARGFSWIIAWSPTSIAQALVVSLVAGANHGRVVAYGIAIMLMVSVAGWIEDRISGARARALLSASGQLPAGGSLAFPGAAFARFALVCVSLAAVSAGVMALGDTGVIPALMVAAPIVTLAWIWLQERGRTGSGRAMAGRLREIALGSIPASCPEAMTLSIAGYAAIVATGLIDAQATADALGLTAVPPLAIYVGMTTIIPILSNAALPPIFTTTFLATFLSATPGLGTDPTLVALALIIGWALNLTASPFSATSLVLGRITGIPGTTLSWRWNGGFTVTAYLIAVATLAVLSLM